MNLRRSRLTLSGLIAENRAVHRFALLCMFGPSPQATLVKHLETTMASADFCPVTPHVTARRAVPMSNWGWGFARFKLAQPTQLSARFVSGTARPSRYSVAALSPHAGQRSPGRCANCRCTSAAFTVGCVPLGFAAMCHRQQHPSALTMRFAVRALQAASGQRPYPSPGSNRPQDGLSPGSASHLLHSGFLRTSPRGLALAFGSWLSSLTMSPSRYSHRGLAPHKFAPMLGAHPSLQPTCYGWLRQPAQAAELKRCLAVSNLSGLPPVLTGRQGTQTLTTLRFD